MDHVYMIILRRAAQITLRRAAQITLLVTAPTVVPLLLLYAL